MLLTGARVATGPDHAVLHDVHLPDAEDITLDLTGHLILPGLINAHDHLEFNLFPRLGNGPYASATEWSRDIYRPDEPPIREQLRIPKRTRLLWGGLKNLLSGVTTVCHHNPYDAAVFENRFPVRVVKRFGWAHSLTFSPNIAALHRQCPREYPFIIHLGEATDADGCREIQQLDELGALDERTVIAHGVALDARGLALVKERGASLIWCPSSNRFLLGRTLHRQALDSGIPVALGSDSALTAAGDLLDELREARVASGLPAARLYEMVTTLAARALRLGELPQDDLIAIPDTGGRPDECLLRAKGARLVVIGGRIKLIAENLGRVDGLHRLHVEGRDAVLVDAGVPALSRDAREALGPEVRLAGRRVLS